MQQRAFKRYHGENYWYFVTTNTEGRARPFASRDLATMVVETLQFYEERGDFDLHAWVVMPDHMHLVLTPLRGTISDVMRNVKSWVAKAVRDRTGRGGSVWQESFHDEVIRSEAHFCHAVQYIHWNPVEAGLVREPEEYEFSSWRLWEGEALGGSGLGP